jgi:hypothetical protein
MCVYFISAIEQRLKCIPKVFKGKTNSGLSLAKNLKCTTT